MVRRRGLSPLIASVLLISATVLGGMLVYHYFQDSFTKIKGLSEDVVVNPSALVLNANTTLVRVTISNQNDQPITVVNVTLLDDNGNTIKASLLRNGTLPVMVQPGEKINVMLKTSEKPAAAYVTYEVNGQVYESEPVQLAG